MQNIFEASACVAIFGFCGFALAAFLVTFVITGARNSGVAAHKITINVREKRVVVHSLFALL